MATPAILGGGDSTVPDRQSAPTAGRHVTVSENGRIFSIDFCTVVALSCKMRYGEVVLSSNQVVTSPKKSVRCRVARTRDQIGEVLVGSLRGAPLGFSREPLARGDANAKQMPDFSPLNEDHAIQNVAFSLVLDQALGPTTIRRAVENHPKWKSETPAIQTPQGVQIDLSGPEPVRRPAPINAVIFSFLRPDGTPAWVLRFMAAEIAVECSRYTRWERVWATARGHLNSALEVVTGTEPGRKVSMCCLTVTDKFRSLNPERYDLKTLFKLSEFIPGKLFQFQGQWHNHSGWFNSVDGSPRLQNLNIGANYEPQIVGEGQQRELFVGILHLQQIRYATPISVGDFNGRENALLEAGMHVMHDENKAVMAAILTEKMASRIGLLGE